MGPRWKSIEHIVFNIADEVILKYVSKDDLYFRHNEDDYMIIFVRDTLEEAQMKCALIAAEIKRLLFESLDDVEEIKELDTDSFVKSFNRSIFDTSNDFVKTMDDDLSSQKDENHALKKDISEKKINIPKTVIDVPEDIKNSQSRKSPDNDPNPENVDFFVVPFISKSKERRNLVIINDHSEVSNDTLNPIKKFFSLFNNVSKSTKAKYEMIILDRVLYKLKKYKNDNFCCSFDYETILSDHYSEIYKRKIANLDESEKNRLKFIITHIPEDVPMPTLKKLIAPLEKKCASVCAYIPLNTKLSLSNIVNCGFKGVGLTILDDGKFTAETLLEEGRKLSKTCHKYGLTISILVSSDDPAFLSAAYSVDFDFIGSANCVNSVN